MILAEVRNDNSNGDDDDDGGDDEEGAGPRDRNLPIEHISVARKTSVVDHWWTTSGRTSGSAGSRETAATI